MITATTLLLTLFTAFILTIIATKLFIPYLHRLKFGQYERELGPASHRYKTGTPTMGGTVFVLMSIIAILIIDFDLLKDVHFQLLAISFVGFGTVGFIDDYLIVVMKDNEGLKPTLKYFLQSVVAIAFYFIFIKYTNFSTIINIPIINIAIDFQLLYPVLIYFMLTGVSNAVNITDGVDGLASGLMIVALFPFVIFGVWQNNLAIAIFSVAVIGALLGFLIFNFHPAKIFMGDVGSLALGGLLASLAIISKTEFLLIIIGGVFMVETLSVILQVAYFKKTKGKRLFKMSPLHHHFELSGWSEGQVVTAFWMTGFILAIVAILIGGM